MRAFWIRIVREKTITLYVNKARFKQQPDILNEKKIYMFLVNKGG